MKILTVGNMYPPHHLGGYELTWRSSVLQLRAAGHSVRVLTTDFRRVEPDADIAEDPDAHRDLRWYWHDHEFPRQSLRSRIDLERHNGRVLAHHMSVMRPDAVCWWAMGGMSLSLIERVRQRGVPSVGVVGDDWMVYGPKVDAWTRLCRRAGPAATVVSRSTGIPSGLDLSSQTWLFNSEATRRRGIDAGLRLDHAGIAHPGVDTDLFREAPEPPWRWRLLYVGRIDERKGITTAIEALDHLPAEATLSVIGGGDSGYLRDLHELCTKLGVTDRVEFRQRPRDELQAAYADADVLLFPVRWEEPWGLVPLEAMTVGTPVVATGTGGSSEYLRSDENAIVVGRGAGTDKLARAVSRLAAEPALRARLRTAGFFTAGGFTERGYNAAIEAALLKTQDGLRFPRAA